MIMKSLKEKDSHGQVSFCLHLQMRYPGFPAVAISAYLVETTPICPIYCSAIKPINALFVYLIAYNFTEGLYLYNRAMASLFLPKAMGLTRITQEYNLN